MHFASALGIGIAVGLANWLFWGWSAKRLLRRGKSQSGWISFLSLLKFGVLAGILWMLLVRFQIDPIGFLLGFTIVLAVSLTRILKWN